MSVLRNARAGAVARALLAAAGAVAAVALGAWPLATACFAGLSALLLDRARDAERRQAEHRRTREPLTGVGDVRALHARLGEVAARDPRRLAALTLDADTLGAVQGLDGDRLLHEVGRLLREGAAGAEVVARPAAHEVAVVLPADGAPDATALARRIEQALAGA